MADHIWIRGSHPADRVRARAGRDLSPELASVDAHRGLRGPYTAGGSLLRAIAVDAFNRCPELASRHNTEVATAAPELAVSVPTAWATLEWTVSDEQRTRYYSRLRTRDIANGIADFLRAYLASYGDEQRTLFVDNVHQADPTDQELFAVLLRRQDIPQLNLVLGTGWDPLVDPPGDVAVSLAEALPAYARLVDGPRPAQSRDPRGYIESDGTTEDPAAIAAYRALSPDVRARRHDERCARLYALGEQSLALGAIPFHAERGTRRATLGVQALKHALGHCRKVGLYHAAADLGLRGRALVDRLDDPALWWHFTEGAAASLATAGRADEAALVYDEARAVTENPAQQLRLAYGTAMLHVRHLPEPRRDLAQARGWMELAMSLARGLPDPKEAAFHSVFARNGLALVEIHEGRDAEALRLVEDGLAVLDRSFGRTEHALLRSVLRLNRGRVLAAAGRLEEALAEHTANTELDPAFPEHHFHVGTLLRRLGRNAEAAAAFERVLPLSPPFPEVHYNLADTWLELGDVRKALGCFDYVLELDPGHLRARVNRAALRCEAGDTHGAWDDVEEGLLQSPDNVHLLCVKARLLAEAGDGRTASAVLSTALRRDPGYAQAWALRGQLRFEAGDFGGALSDYDRAVALGDGPEVRFNRAVVFERVGRYGEAADDYRSVLADSDDEDARNRLEFCLRAVG
ncbi:tetratricopeptide repeat protein [Actinosynnema sp. NPDC020468]|uniref:tetratricopeptide repeat protein n=1 Tax=Actinosynnema sp. NPDC020468 TaxID=3154488 RepID=UPI0033E59955